MSTATSPRLKSLIVKGHVNSFTGGLVGGYFRHVIVSQVDIFIEKPFCSLSLKSASRMETRRTTGHAGLSRCGLTDLAW